MGRVNPAGRPQWLEVGGFCGSRTAEPHLLTSSTMIYTWTNGDRTIRSCLECRRRLARESAAALRAARQAGFASAAEAEAARHQALTLQPSTAMKDELLAGWSASPKRGGLSGHARWACEVYGSTFTLLAWEWSESELAALLSTDSWLGRPAHYKTVQARRGTATDQQRQWNEGPR